MTTITSTYEGELRCSSIHGPSGSSLITDAPHDNEGLGSAFSPTDLVATALGTCILTIMGIVARRHEIDLRGARVQVTKRMTQAGVRRIAALEAQITLPAGLGDEQRALLRRAAEHCPVKESLAASVPLELHWNHAAGAG
ncbi:MAG: OsmC family protein [Synechococcaceae cyanobacterium]|nr:OsmC family protein [Synechococcaceae cyanobacterium]